MLMKNIFFKIILFVTLLTQSGCATILGSQTVKAVPKDERAFVKINGSPISEDGTIKIRKHRPMIVSAYRSGYRPKSEVRNPTRIDGMVFLTMGIWGTVAGVTKDPSNLFQGVVFSASDVALGLKKHKRKVEIAPLEKLPVNEKSGIYVMPHIDLDSLSFNKVNIRVHKNVSSWQSREKNRAQTVAQFEKSYDIIEWLDERLYTMGYQKPQATLIADYENTIHLDAEIKGGYLDVLRGLGSSAELQTVFYLCDHHGERRIPIEALGSSQIFSDNFIDFYEEAMRDALMDALIKVLASDEFKAAFGQMSNLLNNETAKWDQIELSKPIISEPDFQEMVNAQITIIDVGYHGSGCMISPDGYALASYRVVEDKNEVDVQFSDGKTKKAKVIRKDALSNITLLKIDTIGTASLPISTNRTFKVGDDVFSVGSPVNTSLSQSLTSGIVSGEHIQNGLNYIQTDVKVSRGDNGSPLINTKGQLIGVINEKYIGYSLEGLSFAVSSFDVLERLKLSFK